MITLDRPTLTARTLEDVSASALVVGVGTGPDGPVLLTDALPAEAATTVNLIHRGGPFPYSRDGIVFGNFERRLPNQQRGYYHEYTVPTPGAKTRGTRRVITGGEPPTDPPEFYYTGDHYETFCQIGGA